MIPLILLATAGYLALARVPAPAPAARPAGIPDDVPVRPAAVSGLRSAGPARTGLAALSQRAAAASTRSLVALGAAGLLLLGAVPLAVAQASATADPILAQSVAGPTAHEDYPAPGFALTDQYGRTVTLASLRGKVVLLGFLDPVCSASCPAVSQELRQAAGMLGGSARGVELVGVVLSASRRPVSALRAFDRRAGLNGLPDWLVLTGTSTGLRQVWQEYGITVRPAAAGPAPDGDEAYVIDRIGQVAQKYRTGPGPGSTAMTSSFAALFAGAARQALSTRS